MIMTFTLHQGFKKKGVGRILGSLHSSDTEFEVMVTTIPPNSIMSVSKVLSQSFGSQNSTVMVSNSLLPSLPRLRPLLRVVPEQALHMHVRDLDPSSGLFLFLLHLHRYLWFGRLTGRFVVHLPQLFDGILDGR